jgi:hypothetical protein
MLLTRPVSKLVAAAFAGAAFAAVAAPVDAQTKPLGAATPQAAIDQLQASIDKGDAAGAMGVLTPSGRKLFAKDMTMQTLMFLAFMDPDDPMPGGPKEAPESLAKKKKAYAQLKTEVTATFKPLGMDGAIGQPVMKAEPLIDKGLEKADSIDLATKLYSAVLKAAPAFGKDQSTLKLPIKVGPFTALKVEGANATVKSGPKTLKFEQADGKWFLNFPVPEPPEQ